MGCSSCGTSPGGCKSNGHCASGGCNRLNTYDWLSNVDMPDTYDFNVIEVSFKNGARKGFYYNPPYIRVITGDMVVVEAKSGGFDVGRVSLSGELVKLQMKKKRVREDNFFQSVVRTANERDLEKLQEARDAERDTMITARVIARELKLNMKVGDVEYQGDKRKVTIYYTADGRVDFRELIRFYAKEFKVKIEMRQIGARQESARIGGIGSCGRELCCSTWLSGFRSVSTAAARYQNIAINQSKLSGQCGRLKCCLNYELDTYLDALKDFPKRADRVETEVGVAYLVKTDIFKGAMYYAYRNQPFSKVHQLDKERVKEIQKMNKKGKKPAELIDYNKVELALADAEDETGFVDVTGQIELPPEERKKRRRGGSSRRRGGSGNSSSDRSGSNSGRSRGGRSGDDKKPSSGSSKRTGSKPGSSKKTYSKPSSSQRSNRRPNSNSSQKDGNKPKVNSSRNSENKPNTPKSWDKPKANSSRNSDNKPNTPKSWDKPRTNSSRNSNNKPNTPTSWDKPKTPQKDGNKPNTNSSQKTDNKPNSSQKPPSKPYNSQGGDKPAQNPNNNRRRNRGNRRKK